jgi:hypothetical protein
MCFKPQLFHAIASTFVFSLPLCSQDSAEIQPPAIADNDSDKPRPRFFNSHFELAAGVSGTWLDGYFGNRPSPMGYLTDASLGMGAFVEFRQYPGAISHYDHPGLFVRLRLSRTDWGNQRIDGLVGKAQTSDSILSRASIGTGLFFWGGADSKGRSVGLYGAIDYGLAKWDISTTYLGMEHFKSTKIDSWEFFLGIEAYSCFIEIGYSPHYLGRQITSRFDERDLDRSQRWDVKARKMKNNYNWGQKSGGSTILRLGYRF